MNLVEGTQTYIRRVVNLGYSFLASTLSKVDSGSRSMGENVSADGLHQNNPLADSTHA